MKNAARVVSGVVLSLALVAGTGCSRKESGATGPGGPGAVDTGLFNVVLTVSPNPAEKLVPVTLDASASHGGITSFEFDFGDGSPVVTQSSPTTQHAYDLVNNQDTTYVLKLTGCNDDGYCETAGATLLVKDAPPSVSDVYAGPDGRGVIGEWIQVMGENFKETPAITVGAVPVEPAYIQILDSENARFRVPPAVGAGLRDVVIQFPSYEPFTAQIDVRRFALITSAAKNKAYVFDVMPNESFVDTGIRLDLDDAATIKISPEGSTAYVNNGRFAFLSTGTIRVVDLTADGGPETIDEWNVGAGPLFDIETSPKRPFFVAGDALGLHLYNSSDPQAPNNFGYVSALFAGDPANDVAAVDIAINRAGDRLAVLNAWNNQARIFSLNANNQVTNATNPVRVNVGNGTQDAAMSDDGNILYVLGGGGEGAVPPILGQPTLASITAIDAGTGAVLKGPYSLSSLNFNQPVTPIPFDLAVSRSNPNKVYVTTLDEGFSEMFDLIEQILDGDWEKMWDLMIFLSNDGLSFGATWPVNNASTFPVLGSPMQETFTAPTAAELLYNDHKMLQSSFRVWWDENEDEIIFETGATVITPATGQSTFLPLETEPIGLQALFDLFQPPFSFGDVSIQP